MIKSFAQLKNFVSKIPRLMNRELKNLKISPEVHTRLKIAAATNGIAITDYADILITLALDEIDHQKGISKSGSDIKRAKTPERTKR